jgi:hypothetical protein
MEGPVYFADPPCIKKYPVVYGQANLVASILKETYKGTWIRISAAGENAIFVYGAPADQKEIAEQILTLRNRRQIRSRQRGQREAKGTS